jgi:hypothetical protein
MMKQNSVEMDLKETKFVDVGWIFQSLGRAQWWAFATLAIKCSGFIKMRKYFH